MRRSEGVWKLIARVWMMNYCSLKSYVIEIERKFFGVGSDSKGAFVYYH